jgi:hypothetical protein
VSSKPLLILLAGGEDERRKARHASTPDDGALPLPRGEDAQGAGEAVSEFGQALGDAVATGVGVAGEDHAWRKQSSDGFGRTQRRC